MNDARSLRTALKTNALFSSVCGGLLLLGPSTVGDLLGVQAPLIFQTIGVGLIVFAADLLHQATRYRITVWRAVSASAADILWVVGTVLLLVLFPELLSAAGRWLAAGIAVVVLTFGIWQWRAIGRTRPAAEI